MIEGALGRHLIELNAPRKQNKKQNKGNPKCAIYRVPGSIADLLPLYGALNAAIRIQLDIEVISHHTCYRVNKCNPEEEIPSIKQHRNC